MSKRIAVLCLALLFCAAPQLVVAQSKSEKSKEKVTLTVVNKGGGDIETFWVSFKGEDKSYGMVGAGKDAVQQTFSKHVWKVTAGKRTFSYTTSDESKQKLLWTGSVLVLPSTKGGKEVKLQVKNGGKGEIEALWIDYTGEVKSFSRKINPGNTIDIPTGANQTWFIQRKDGSTVGYYRTTEKDTQLIEFMPGSGLVVK